MANRPKNIGTAAETAVVRELRATGFPAAERRSLHGGYDKGDVTGCPGLVWEVKAGEAAASASDGQVASWLEETEVERENADADYGILVLRRRGIGAARAGRWWAVLPGLDFVKLATRPAELSRPPSGVRVPVSLALALGQVSPVRLWLSDAVLLLRGAGYGLPLGSTANPQREVVAGS